MELDILPNRDVDVTPLSVGIGVVVLVVLFWISIRMNSSTALVHIVRAGVGTTLLIIVPGVLLARLLGVPTYPLGRFGLYAAGLSLAYLAALTTAMSTLLPLVGVMNPLSITPLMVAVSTLLFGLVFAVYTTGTSLVDTQFDYSHVSLSRPLPVVALLCILPVLAVIGAVLMNHFAVNTGMFVVISAIVVIVVLAATRFVPSRLYPAMVFSVSVSTLLHHNLLSQHVIGADIQGLYFVADLLTQLHHWPTPTGGTAMAIPVVTTVPASFSILTGISLTTTFTVVYVLLFAFVPLGMFSVCQEVFDDDIALFATFFFLFYHITFTFTPEKQLLSELFAVLLIMVVVRGDLRGYGRSIAVLLLSLGLIGSHYGTTILFGVALLFAAIVLFAVNRLVSEVTPRPPLWYPVALLAGASAWYAYASAELFARLTSVPGGILAQAFTLLNGGGIEGSGASYVSQQTLLGTLNVSLYGLFIALTCVGVGWRILTTLSAFRRREVPDDIGYTALAIPVLVFLASSYFFVFNLWADRAYQMALVFIAPFMPLGYRYLDVAVSAVGERVWSLRSTPERTDGGTRRDSVSESQWSTPRSAGHWTVLAVLLAGLLTLNSGLAFALAGTAQNSAFNANANDLVFSQKEVQGVTWLKTHIDPSSPLEINQSPTSNRSGVVRIYTDPRSAQLLRSTLPESYYDVKIILLKSRWRPEVHPDKLNDGYVVIRWASVANAQQANSSSSLISRSNVLEIIKRGTVIFHNNDILIVKLRTDMKIDNEEQ